MSIHKINIILLRINMPKVRRTFISSQQIFTHLNNFINERSFLKLTKGIT